MGNTNLSAAKAAKNDEFYSQWRDIENEMMAYWVYNKDVFKDKTILLPCDDPRWSNFTRFFARNFEQYQIKKLISTSYAQASNAAIDEHNPAAEELERPDYDAERSWTRGRKFVLERGVDLTGDGQIDLDDLQWEYLEGDGDFRSEEVTALRDEADIVITNAPFSLMRDFIAWVAEGEVLFSTIANSNAVTYKEIFPLIKDNLMWKGATANSTDLVFEVPAHVEVKQSDMDKAERLGYPSENGRKFTRLGNACWFTNIQHGRRHEKMQLMTMADNLMYSRRKKIREQGYPKYNNYDAIEVGFTEAIPSDYDGVMGVPISFLDKYNPEQFEIIWRGGDMEWAENECTFFTPPAKEQQQKHRSANKTWRVQNPYVLNDDGSAQTIYQRIFIRHKK